MTTSAINQSLSNQKNQLLNHSLYEKVKTIDDLN